MREMAVFSLLLLALALAVVPGRAKMLTAAIGTADVHNRTAILSEFFVGGSKNVRWETMPAVMVDKDGKTVPSGTGKAGDMSCVDMEGRSQSNGNEYTRKSGKFKYRCNNGVEEVIACQASDRANKQWIKVGESVTEDGFWHKCESFPNNSVVYTQENACTYNGKRFHAGEEMHVGSLRLECQESGYKVVGCYYLGDDHKPVPLETGAKKEVGKTVHSCDDSNGDVRYSAVTTGCTKKGKEYKEGEEFKEGHLRYKCEKGVANILGCYMKEDKALDIGQDVVDEPNHMVYRCYRLGGAIEYMEYACGVKGTPSCKPEPIPETPNDVPALGLGLKSPGFAHFAVVQTMNSKMAAQPNSLRLELDKILAGAHMQH